VVMNKKIIFGLILVAVAVVVFIAFTRDKRVEVAEPNDEQVKLVETAVVEQGKAERVSGLSGVLEATGETTVAFEVSGRILEMRYAEGDSVSVGAVLARVDATEYSLQLTSARTGMEKAQVGYQQARDDFDRMKQLYESGAISSLILRMPKTG